MVRLGLPSPQDEPKKERKRDKVMGFLGGVLGKDTEKDNKGSARLFLSNFPGFQATIIRNPKKATVAAVSI